MNEQVAIWGWSGAAWVKVLVDAAGRLQVETVGGALLEYWIYAYDGAAWQTLLVESNTLKNLRVKLYDGANGIDSTLLDGSTMSSSNRGLPTKAGLCLWDSYNNYWSAMAVAYRVGDGDGGYSQLPVYLWGYNGSTWDRLRTYGTGILKVGRAEVGLSTIRRTGTGQVKGSAGKLYWMTMNPSAAASIIELSDDTDGAGAIVWEMVHGVNSAHHMNLDPPMEFANGIYLKTLTNFVSVIFGYL